MKEHSAQSWLEGQGFKLGDMRSEQEMDGYKVMTPMARASEMGELGVCKFLLEEGAINDCTKANHQGYTPMLRAAANGHLSICQWLLDMGATEDISRAEPILGNTPMLMACRNDHLSVCEWLFEVGAAGDITKADNNGKTPMHWALRHDHLRICCWLILNGALNYCDEEAHVDPALVMRTIRAGSKQDCLHAWATEVEMLQICFYNVAAHASFARPQEVYQNHASNQNQNYRPFPILPRVILKRVACFLGVESGRKLRNVREFSRCLEMLGADSAASAVAGSSVSLRR